jgi:hypothetical protein
VGRSGPRGALRSDPAEQGPRLAPAGLGWVFAHDVQAEGRCVGAQNTAKVGIVSTGGQDWTSASAAEIMACAIMGGGSWSRTAGCTNACTRIRQSAAAPVVAVRLSRTNTAKPAYTCTAPSGGASALLLSQPDELLRRLQLRAGHGLLPRVTSGTVAVIATPLPPSHNGRVRQAGNTVRSTDPLVTLRRSKYGPCRPRWLWRAASRRVTIQRR